MAYGYRLQGGLSGYNVIDQRILDGDDGNYLIPVQPATGYAESALTEPWACVTAAYGLKYRTGLKDGGTAWIVGGPPGVRDQESGNSSYTISAGFDAQSHPARLLLTQVPAAFEAWLRERSASLGIEVIAVDDPAAVETPVDDLILLEPDADTDRGDQPEVGGLRRLCAHCGTPAGPEGQRGRGPRALQPLGLRRRDKPRHCPRVRRRPCPVGAQAGRTARGSSAPADRWGACMSSAPSRWPAAPR